MKLVFATHNSYKLKEIQQMLPSGIELLSLVDMQVTEEIPETADTLRDNALLKATYIHQIYKTNCFADDSGLEVNTLNGAPGVYSARYAGPQKNDADNVEKLLKELQGKQDRTACFKTVISLIIKGQNHFFEGRIDGHITTEKHGEQGFGYDPVFMPNDYDKTFAQMSPTEKNSISHRALAVNKLVDFLQQYKL